MAPQPNRRRIPDATVSRLPVYLRILGEQGDAGVDSMSSERLAELAGVNAAKVRKDLSYLGSYGVRGVGYEVGYLVFQIRRELGLTHDWPVVIVGAGTLGQALAGFGGFSERGFPVVGVVDRMDLDRALGDLPDGCRAVFVLHDVEGFEHREIAGMLGIAEGTSKSQLHKARLRLSAALRTTDAPARGRS